MIKRNHDLIKGSEVTDEQKVYVAQQLLAARSTPEQARRFYMGVKFPSNIDGDGRRMYPIFFLPPYNGGRKMKTVLNQTPKTQILSSNMYELEILRLLHLLCPQDPDVEEMIDVTLQRLKTTCFGYWDDGVGEYFDTSLVVLRFISTVVPNETAWIKSRIANYNNHVHEKKRPWFSPYSEILLQTIQRMRISKTGFRMSVKRIAGCILIWNYNFILSNTI